MSLDDLERLVKAATPGRWIADNIEPRTIQSEERSVHPRDVVCAEEVSCGRLCQGGSSNYTLSAENAKAIVALRNHAEALIAVARAVQSAAAVLAKVRVPHSDEERLMCKALVGPPFGKAGQPCNCGAQEEQDKIDMLANALKALEDVK